LDGILEGDDSNRIESEMLKENNYYFSHDNKTLAYVQYERWREIDLSYENILIITIVLSNYNMQMVLIYDGSAMNIISNKAIIQIDINPSKLTPL
jgi:uncharacterized membrane protein YobD (UPF0266 family)